MLRIVLGAFIGCLAALVVSKLVPSLASVRAWLAGVIAPKPKAV